MTAAVDTIVACASPWGRGAVALLRLSGPDSRAIVAALCPGGPAWRPRVAAVRLARDAAGGILDELLVTWMPGPRSYTGEDVVELGCHGNPAVVEALLDACVAHGARPARPGEFTRRAFEHGRIDLLQAEAVDALIGAATLDGARLARSAGAALAPVVGALRERLLDLAAELEARLDHPGEDLGEEEDESVAAALGEVAGEARALAGTWRAGRIQLEGARVGLVGPVNAGKSSLFNALLGERRALVSDEPGTTRDVVERPLLLDGVAVTLLDSAGEREGATPLEQAGLALGRELLAEADLVLLVLPAHRDEPQVEAALRQRLRGRPHLVVRTHADLVPADPVPGDDAQPPQNTGAAAELLVSNHTGAGLDALRAALRRSLLERPPGTAGVVLLSQRQHALLHGVAANADEAADALLGPAGPAVAAEAVTTALSELAELTGEDVREAVLDRLFARFCVGK